MLATCHRFELELDQEIADRLEPFEGGVAVITTRVPLIWSANYLLLEPGSEADGDRVEELVGEHLGSRGMRHGAIEMVEAGENEELGAALVPRGWKLDRTVYMVARGAPDREPGAPVEEVPPGAIEDVRREVGTDSERVPGTIDQLLERDRMLDSVASGRWFAAIDEGAPRSACVLFSRGGIGQIETVITSPGARNRGLARAAILAALDASRSTGNELTFLAADADDWPKVLYERLGFDPVGIATGFIRKPTGRD